MRKAAKTGTSDTIARVPPLTGEEVVELDRRVEAHLVLGRAQDSMSFSEREQFSATLGPAKKRGVPRRMHVSDTHIVNVTTIVQR